MSNSHDFKSVIKQLLPQGLEVILEDDAKASTVIGACASIFYGLYETLLSVAKSSCPLEMDDLIYPRWQRATNSVCPSYILASPGIRTFMYGKTWNVTNTMEHLQNIAGEQAVLEVNSDHLSVTNCKDKQLMLRSILACTNIILKDAEWKQLSEQSILSA